MEENGRIHSEMDFCGNDPPISTDPFRDHVIGDRQQAVINELRTDMCREDKAYLSTHREVEAVAVLLLREILKKKPRDPFALAARLLKDPSVAKRIGDYRRSSGTIEADLLDQDDRFYALDEDKLCGTQVSTYDDLDSTKFVRRLIEQRITVPESPHDYVQQYNSSSIEDFEGEVTWEEDVFE
ncbi:uncharacterized protein LOC126832916 [Adelges cooleyi]|uniref:uncharacterized protein LOC126832916 n=1 Tax=Adelges cooleyi TaxID=133065 RepID=UPI00217FACB8|nr:uncharacterized protein LOC126832916 [Adelges cooleyi]